MNALGLVALMATVTFEAPPVVSEFLESDAFVRVIHGPVGSGKSSGCVMEILRRSIEQKPDANGVRDTRWAVIRNTYRELEDTTRRTFDQWLGPLGKWVEADFTFSIDKPLEDGTRLKSEVLFRALDRPQDVKKLLSLELTGAYVNELREVPKIILDGLTMRVGRYPSMKDGGSTWDGIWADTNPWAESSEYAKLFKAPPKGFVLFRQPSGLGPDAENKENLKPDYYSRMCAGKDAEWIAEYVEGKNPRADKGSVYGALLADLEARGGVAEFQHERDGVFAVFDLGISDATSCWFFRANGQGAVDLVDWYEASGLPLSHYVDMLRARGYQYRKILLPHDARARTLQTGVSTVELMNAAFPGLVAIGPELSIEDGIGAGRWLLEQPTRFHARCAEGLERLRAYKYEWDEERKVYRKKPLHDWTSHTADGYRYVAAYVQSAWRQSRPKTTTPAAGPPKTWTWQDDPTELHRPSRGGRERL